MDEQSELAPLDYRSPPRPTRRQRPPETEAERHWRYRRWTYYAASMLVFGSVAFYFGPNWLLFSKFTRPAPADFAPAVEQVGNPVVRALLQYRADTGQFPRDGHMEDLEPKYLPPSDRSIVFFAQGHVEMFGAYHHWLTYDLTPGQEGWTVWGPYAHGRVPTPIVRLEGRVSTQP